MHAAAAMFLLVRFVLATVPPPLVYPKPDPAWTVSCADDVVAHMAESTDHNPICDKRKL